MIKIRRVISLCLALCLFAALFSSCGEDNRELVIASPAPDHKALHIAGEARRVVILYSAGFNNLSDDLKTNIKELEGGFVPRGGRNDNVLLVFSQNFSKGAGYTAPNPPVLFRIYKNEAGVIRDTIKVFKASDKAIDAELMKEVLAYVKDNIPAKSYGMIYTSHGTGWLPPGYYASHGSSYYGFSQKRAIGAHQSSISNMIETDIVEFAKAFPMRMEYVLFDACLMGGIELAYEMKDACRYFGASPAEIPVGGFNYKRLGTRLLSGAQSDIRGVCEDYYERYKDDDVYGATITLIDCNKLEPLADLCSSIFEKYRSQIASVDASKVQHFYRYSKSWFFDLGDMMVKSGISQAEELALNEAFDNCMLYRAHTPDFMKNYGGFEINAYCGVSSYLPNVGNATLDTYYRSLKWNVATSFVK